MGMTISKYVREFFAPPSDAISNVFSTENLLHPILEYAGSNHLPKINTLSKNILKTVASMNQTMLDDIKSIPVEKQIVYTDGKTVRVLTVDQRVEAARSENSSINLLPFLSNDPDLDVRKSAARNPNMPARDLVTLAEDPDSDVRESAARNPNMPAKDLVTLARDSNFWVRESAAGNPNMPAATLVTLAQDPDQYVLESAAGNPNMPVETLVTLARYPNYWVQESAARNLRLRFLIE